VAAQDLLNTASQQILAIAEPLPAIVTVANAEGENLVIAPNTWVEIKGSNLAKVGFDRIWGSADFVGNSMPTALNGVSATVNGNNAYVYYVSPEQVNILTPPDAMSGLVQVQVTNNGATASFTAQAQPLAPSFFVFNGGPNVAATHVLVAGPGDDGHATVAHISRQVRVRLKDAVPVQHRRDIAPLVIDGVKRERVIDAVGCGALKNFDGLFRIRREVRVGLHPQIYSARRNRQRIRRRIRPSGALTSPFSEAW
jgi:hypothetical protein